MGYNRGRMNSYLRKQGVRKCAPRVCCKCKQPIIGRPVLRWTGRVARVRGLFHAECFA